MGNRPSNIEGYKELINKLQYESEESYDDLVSLVNDCANYIDSVTPNSRFVGFLKRNIKNNKPHWNAKYAAKEKCFRIIKNATIADLHYLNSDNIFLQADRPPD